MPKKQTSIVLFEGGPCTGKSTMLEEMRALGYRVQEEVARKLINNIKKEVGDEAQQVVAMVE